MTAGAAPPVAATCEKCGSPAPQGSSYLTEVGLLCWPCFERHQNERRHVDARVAREGRSLSRRARMLAAMHGIMWASAAIIATGETGLPRWLGTALLLLVLALVVGLGTLRRQAFLAALILDVAGVLGILAWAVYLRAPLVVVGTGFPLSLFGFAWVLRAAYATAPDGALLTTPGTMLSTRGRKWAGAAVAAAIVATAGGAALLARQRARPIDPARELMRATLPTWQLTRARERSGGTRPSPATTQLLAAARPWPALASAFQALDRGWPDDALVRQAITATNRALADAGLRYFASVWTINGRPYVLSHELVSRVPWRIGARAIELLRVQRLDTLNIDFAFDGVTQDGLPMVMLDRVEATLARELPVMYAAAKERLPGAPPLDDFDRAALARRRTWLEARIGPGLAPAVAALRERNRLVEEMRTRLRGSELQLAGPDGFVLGEAFLDRLAPDARLDRPEGPLFLDTDLKAVVRADEALRAGPFADALRAAVELMTLVTEPHEARHAAEESAPSGPPPPALFEVMPDSSSSMVRMADSELQAFLGELHDGPAPACVSLAGAMRAAYGHGARREPHFYAALALMKQLDARDDGEPEQQLSSLCALPDGELRGRLATAWQRLYGAPMPAAVRSAAPR